MYKKYESGLDFIEENLDILNANPLSTCFFKGNAQNIKGFGENHYIFKFIDGEKYLFLLCLKPWNLLLHGSASLCEEAAKIVAEHKFSFDGVLAELDLANAFLESYEKYCGGSHKVSLSMEIMYADSVKDEDTSTIERCTKNDIEEVVDLAVAFVAEAVHEKKTKEEIKDKIKDSICDFYCIRESGKIVSLGRLTRAEDQMASLSYVYTLPEFRVRGLSRKVVTYITQKILDEGKIPYLFVDQENPITNHLYSTIGYVYDTPKYEVKYMK